MVLEQESRTINRKAHWNERLKEAFAEGHVTQRCFHAWISSLACVLDICALALHHAALANVSDIAD